LTLKWYLYQDGKQMGPYSWDQLLCFANEGSITPVDYLWNRELVEWTGAGQIGELFPSSASPPAPDPHPPAAADHVPFPTTASPPPAAAEGDNFRIEGGNFPVVEITLAPESSYYAEAGAMAWMSSNVNMRTQMRGGLFKGLSRKFMGESLFLCSFSCENGQGRVAFAPDFAGVIKPLRLREGEAYICQRNSFLVAQDTVDLSLELKKKLGAGFFGGEGFILQRLTGPGLAFVEIDGSAIERELAPGEVLQVATGFVAMYEASVTMNITRVKGISNLLFGSEGVFLTTLTGPGKVWLQTMPFAQLAGKITATIPSRSS